MRTRTRGEPIHANGRRYRQWSPRSKTSQRRRTHCTHRRAAGSASSLIAGISVPHLSQIPYVPAASRESAASISRISASVSFISAAIFARSNAIVDPSGSCSSSSVVHLDPSITDASSSRRDSSRCSERDRSAPSAAPKSVTTPVDPRGGLGCRETASAPTEFSRSGQILPYVSPASRENQRAIRALLAISTPCMVSPPVRAAATRLDRMRLSSSDAEFHWR